MPGKIVLMVEVQAVVEVNDCGDEGREITDACALVAGALQQTAVAGDGAVVTGSTVPDAVLHFEVFADYTDWPAASYRKTEDVVRTL
jgi:hypothetical protein